MLTLEAHTPEVVVLKIVWDIQYILILDIFHPEDK